jgi:hypothetical protein
MQLTLIFLIIPYTRMSQPIMPDLECINIMENHFIYNIWYWFYVCVVHKLLYVTHSYGYLYNLVGYE